MTAFASPAVSPERADATDFSVAEFCDLVDREFDRARLSSFWSLETAFERLVNSAAAARALNTELHKLVRNPSYMGDWRPNQLLLHRGRGFALSIWLFEQSRQYAHTMPFYGMYAPMSSQALSYTRYELPEDYRNEVFDPRVRIQPLGPGSVAPGQVLKLEGDRYVYDFHIDKPVPVFKLTTAPFHSMEWLFNKNTGYAWQANDSELTATQLRVAAYILGKLADPSSVEPLSQLTRHAHHSVRWAAIQGLGRISRSAAIGKLEQATLDPHPHIQRAADKMLQQIRNKS